MPKHACDDDLLNRRSVLKAGSAMFGLSLAELLALRRSSASTPGGFGRAKSCIVFFSWGGMSQLETFDPKPAAPSEYRGVYSSIPTNVPGIRIGEYLPNLAHHIDQLAIVRSVFHPEAGHRNAAYWNLTGHAPHTPGNDSTILPSRRDWPCLGAMVSRFRGSRPGFPGNVAIPYPIADRGLVNGQDAGFLGMTHDPLLIRPEGGRPYAGVSPPGGNADLRLPPEVDHRRMTDRRSLVERLAGPELSSSTGSPTIEHYQRMAADLLLRPEVAAAFDVGRESDRVRDAYGRHVCGQSALQARRLTEAGVPLVMVYSSVGDLNGSAGDNWDTHGNNFNRLRNDLIPPLERASIALLEDLHARGRLDETLVVWLTEFGRTPRLNGAAGRDHFPNCYSVAFAGAGIRGGQVYGRSDAIASAPADAPCGPADLHATIFHALGISADAHVHDSLGRPMPLCDGVPLPLF